MPGESAGAAGGATARRSRIATVVLVATWVVVALGAAIRVDGWARRPSFWVDELRLAVNVAERTLPELLRGPLRYDYLVPPGYLAVERAAFLAFGRDERGLRLASLLAGVAALGLVAALARRALGAELALLPATLVAAGAPLVAYANDARPYALDLALGAALPLVALRWLERPDPARRRTLLFAFAAVPLFSFGATIGGAGTLAGLALSPDLRRDGSRRRTLAWVALAWLVVSTAVALPLWLGKQADERSREGLGAYWTAVGGFPASAAATRAWLGARLAAFGRFPFAPLSESVPPAAMAALLAAGAAALWIDRSGSRSAALLLIGPPVAGLAAALAGLYPLGARLTLYHAAPAAILLGALFAWPAILVRQRRRAATRVAAATAALAALVAAPIAAEAWRRERGFELQPARDLVAELAARARPDDRIYVDYGAEPAWSFYAPAAGLEPARAALGVCGAADPAAALPLSAADPPGTRLWLLFSTSIPEERDWLLARLAGRALPAASVDLTDGRSRVERLDLYVATPSSEPAAAADAPPPPPPKGAAWRCAFFEEG